MEQRVGKPMFANYKKLIKCVNKWIKQRRNLKCPNKNGREQKHRRVHNKQNEPEQQEDAYRACQPFVRACSAQWGSSSLHATVFASHEWMQASTIAHQCTSFERVFDRCCTTRSGDVRTGDTVRTGRHRGDTVRTGDTGAIRAREAIEKERT